MRILCVHNKFQQYGGSDAVFAADEELLAQHGDVITYTRHSGEIESAAHSEKVRLGVGALYSRRTVREITDLVERSRPDVAYVHNIFPLISPSLFDVLYRLRVPAVHITVSYTHLDVYKRQLTGRLFPWARKGGLAILDQGLISGSNFVISVLPVSYTHLDVYKRQGADAIAAGRAA